MAQSDSHAQKQAEWSRVPMRHGRVPKVIALAGGALVVVATMSLLAAAPWAVDSTVPRTVASGTGAVPFDTADSSGASCFQVYSPSTLPDATFAFAGTVTAIDTGGPFFTDEMLFDVDDWYRGGDGGAVSLPMPAPARRGDTSFFSGQDAVPSVTVGARLLVAGSSRSGRPGMADPQVWATCGFVRYYDDETAAVWQAVLTD